MTTRILLKIDKDQSIIKEHPINNSRKFLEINRGTTFSNDNIRTEDGAAGVNMVNNGNLNTLRTGADGTTNILVSNIDGVIFDLPQEFAELLNHYLCFKEKVRQAQGNCPEFLVDVRGLAYNDGSGLGNNSENTFEIVGGNKLVINENSFGAGKDWSDFHTIKTHFDFRNINDANCYIQNPTDNFTTELETFEEFYKLVFEFKEKYRDNGVGYITAGNKLPNSTEIKNYKEKLREFFPGLGVGIYTHNDTTPISAINGETIQSILAGTRSDASSKAKIKNLVKLALYDLETLTNTAGNFEKFIIFASSIIDEFKVWRDCGLDNIDDILRVKANGFWIGQRDGGTNLATGSTSGGIHENAIGDVASVTNIGRLTPGTAEGDTNIAEIIKAIGNLKYRGFDIISDPTALIQPAQFTSRDKNEILFGRVAIPGKYTKQKIDGFRKRMHESGITNWQTETNRKNCLGFQPEDIRNKEGEYIVSNHGSDATNSGNTRTKICFDIWEAKSFAEALNLAFFGTGFTINDVDGTGRIGFVGSYVVKGHDFNETNENKAVLLEKYKDHLMGKESSRASWDDKPVVVDILGNITAVTTGQAQTNYNDGTAAYTLVKNWVNIWGKNYSSKTLEDDKNELESDLVILQDIQMKSADAVNKWEVKLMGRWGEQIKSFITKIDDKLKGRDDNTEYVSDDKIDEEINKGRKSEAAKKLLETAKGYKITEVQLVKLLELITWIEKASAATDVTNYSEDALLELRAIKTSAKTVWEKVVRDFKEKDDDDKAWVEKSLEKLEEILTKVKSDAKDVIDEIKRDDPYNVSGIDLLTNIIKINEIKDLFKLCHDAYELLKRETDDKKFNTLKLKKTSNGDNWTAVNNYKKNNKGEVENEGYAAGALKHLQAFVEESLEKHNKILAITDEAELEKALETELASLEGNEKEEFSKMRFPMYKGRLKLTDASDEEKELKELLGLTPDQYAEDTRDNLNIIEDKIGKLRAYESASETDKKGKALKKAGGDTLKVSLTLFIKKMESKRDYMKTIVEEQEKNDRKEIPSSPEENFWGKPLGIIIIISGIAVFLAMIVYFLKRNAREEE